ncbi:glycosyltransferase family 2 protein [Fictibacillus sp. S7]|uniref:glycosyltransferase family 2 protein n=1 Tax=Fictibacillus sp. S7 TaxID=2212476 RepID=UPI00101298E9|nr:glycosyltransferase family 2 protein [Fictibacillus sp. S7]RXZ01496.1 hypothetical protein DMO16_18625 [Fictibacillus sp. S7]
MDKSKELISVVVPTYNREKLIRRTIKSVLNQTYSNFELLIIDDASTDNTEAVVKTFNDSRIKYFKLEKNSKGTKPRNIGIKEASGEFIALLDSDDEWVNDKLEKQLKYVRETGYKDIVCFTGVILKDDKKEVLSSNESFDDKNDIMEYILLHDNVVQTSTYMLSSDLAKKTMFGENVKKHQDWDFCLRLKKNGANFIYLPEHLSIYYSDNREGRIANDLKYELSNEWAKSIKDVVSEKVYNAFLAKIVANQLILSGKRIMPLKILSKAYNTRSINSRTFVKGVMRCLRPVYFNSIKLKK